MTIGRRAGKQACSSKILSSLALLKGDRRIYTDAEVDMQ